MTVFLVSISMIIGVPLLLLTAWLPRLSLRQRAGEFSGLLFAHRGLWSASEKIPENSLPAFLRAAAAGFAIELDVQLTRDEKAVVFHDSSLSRMCGRPGQIRDYTWAELCRFRLGDTPETIPLLAEVLRTVNGRVPLLIELKDYTSAAALCRTVSGLLADYQGKYCIESFSPLVLHWYKKHRPGVIRGQLSCRFEPGTAYPGPILFLSEHLLFNWYGRPDFIAYEFQRGISLRILQLFRKYLGTPVFAWTINSESMLKKSKPYFDSVIFDRFLPECQINTQIKE